MMWLGDRFIPLAVVVVVVVACCGALVAGVTFLLLPGDAAGGPGKAAVVVKLDPVYGVQVVKLPQGTCVAVLLGYRKGGIAVVPDKECAGQ